MKWIGQHIWDYISRFRNDVYLEAKAIIPIRKYELPSSTVGDYKVMAEDMQELKRYIKQLGEVVVYYRNVTIKNPDGTSEQGVGVSNSNDDSIRPSIGLFPRQKD